jgi:hypothetical protein
MFRRGASSLRARLASPDAAGNVNMQLADADGLPLCNIEGVAFRPAASGLVRAPRAAKLYRLDWVAFDQPASMVDRERVALLGEDAWGLAASSGERERHPLDRHADLAALSASIDAGAAAPSVIVVALIASPRGLRDAAHDAIHGVNALLKGWLADERLAHCRLVFVTRGAVAVQPGEGVRDLGHAAVWGLLRSVQFEHVERRIELLDLDEPLGSLRVLLASAQSQLAFRNGLAYVPRLAAVRPSDSASLARDVRCGRDHAHHGRHRHARGARGPASHRSARRASPAARLAPGPRRQRRS